MRVLRGTLTFVLGMIIGIVLFVLAIGGAVYVVGTSVTVGKLQQNFTQDEIISSDSTLYNQTILDAIKNVVSDVKNIGSLTLQTLYEHYGLSVLNGISGIDFTNKDFYSVPISELMNDLSIVTNSFTLEDISGLANVDFSSYGLPILDDNLKNNIQTALNNIMGSLNGDLSVRKIKDSFGIDIGTEDNKLIATIQDVALSSFGEVVNAITLDKLIEADTDSFVVKGLNQVYVKVDAYEEVSAEDLKNTEYSPAIGIETYIAGATDTDGDGTTDKLVEKELRYVKKTSTADDGTESVSYVVDNSSYAEDFNADENETVFFRHVLYKTPTEMPSSIDDLYIITLANRIATFDNETKTFTLVQKAFTPVKDIDFGTTLPSVEGDKLNIQSVQYTIEDESGASKTESSAEFFVKDETITKDSMLRTLEEGETGSGDAYLRTHKGTSATILQLVAYMSVTELQNADGLLDSLTIGDVVDTEAEGTAKVLVALKDCKITEIGTKINDLTIDQLIEIDENSAAIMKALEKRGCTLNDLATIADELTIGEVMDIDYDKYEEAADGKYVAVSVFVEYNKYAHGDDATRYDKVTDSEGKVTYEEAAEGQYAKVLRYRLYDEDIDGKNSDGAIVRYNLTTEGTTALALQQMAKRGYTLKSIGSELNNMYFDELVRIKEGDNVLMRSLSKKDATLDNLSTIVDDLMIDEVIEIGDDSSLIMRSLAGKNCKINELGTVADTLMINEVIEIGENSARIMRSLAARECLIKDLGTVANDLTLAETTDIAFYKYNKNDDGKYVKVVDTSKYVFYDSTNTLFDIETYGTYDKITDSEGNVTYEKNEEGQGKYAHPFYFTLYNPAVHSGLSRYDCVTEDSEDTTYNPSSRVLQRMAYSTLGEFSTAFSSLTLGDVMDIDIDILVKDEEAVAGTSYFYYDEANCLFKRQGENFDAKSVDEKYQNFKVTVEGESAAAIKRLAYVKVDNLSSAMELVMKDMLLAELIDVYTFSTVETDASTAIADTDRFVVSKIYGTDDNGTYTFVYDATGKYIKREYQFVKADVSTLTKGNTVYYKYEEVTDPTTIIDTIADGNVYYRGTKDGTNYEYNNNTALCAYVINKNTKTEITGWDVYTNTPKYSVTLDGGKIFKRVAASNDDTAAIEAETYTDSGLYVLVNGKYQPYDSSNLAHLGLDIYKMETGECFVDKSTPDIASSGYAYKDGETLYAKRYCENIYFKTDDTSGDDLYVIIANEPQKYDSSKHADSLQRYKAVVGYLAETNEVYLKKDDDYDADSKLADAQKVSVINEKSESVLRLIAEKKVTMANINDVIKEATIGDLMEVNEGSLFYDFRTSKLNDLSGDLEQTFKTMTMKELLNYANISGVDQNVQTALEPITLEKFFTSMEYSKDAGIVLNLEKAYGYEE